MKTSNKKSKICKYIQAKNPKFVTLCKEKIYHLTKLGSKWPLNSEIPWVAGSKESNEELNRMSLWFDLDNVKNTFNADDLEDIKKYMDNRIKALIYSLSHN